MVINDLKQTCPRCQGSGRQMGISALGVTQVNPGGRCTGCAGRGFLLTELGQDLVNLLRPFIEAMIAAGQPPPRPGTDDEP